MNFYSFQSVTAGSWQGYSALHRTPCSCNWNLWRISFISLLCKNQLCNACSNSPSSLSRVASTQVTAHEERVPWVLKAKRTRRKGLKKKWCKTRLNRPSSLQLCDDDDSSSSPFLGTVLGALCEWTKVPLTITLRRSVPEEEAGPDRLIYSYTAKDCGGARNQNLRF